MRKQKDYLDVIWDHATLGSMIKSLRMCAELSQTHLAEQLGVSKQFLNGVEANRKLVGIPFIKKLSTTLGYPVEPFLELLVRDQLRKEGLERMVSITNTAVG